MTFHGVFCFFEFGGFFMKIKSSVKNKILILLGAMFFLFVINNLWAVINLRKLDNSINAIMKSNYNSIVAVQDMSLILERQDSLQLSYIFTQDKNYIKKFNENRENFYENLKIEQNNITEKGEKELSDTVAKNYERYNKKFDEFLKTKNEKEMQKFYFKEIFPLFEEMKENFRDLINLNQNSMLNKKERAAEISQQAVLSIILLVSATTIIGIILSSFIVNGIFAQFRELIEKMNKISEGDYSQKIKPLNDKELKNLGETFNKMSSELSAYKAMNIKKIMAEKRKAEAVVENISDGIIVTDLNNKIILINKAAKILFGIHLKDENKDVNNQNFVGKDFSQVIDNEEIFEKIKQNIEKENPAKEDRKFDLILNPQNKNHEIHTKIFIKKILIEEENIGIVVLIQDITKLKKIDEMKSDFVATVSHEFKTPLTSMKMAVNMLGESKNFSEEQMECVNIIKEDNERLNFLINDLLDLSRIESGKVVMDMRENSAAEMVSNAVNSLRKLFENENVICEINGTDKDYKFNGDFNKITWVMTNLLTNAVKYKDEKRQLKIKISVVKNGDKIIFSVEDNGIGIEEEFHEKIFNKFIRVNVSKEGKVTGTGLGLSICKGIIEAHKGRIWVQSKKGVGSTFYFELNSAKN